MQANETTKERNAFLKVPRNGQESQEMKQRLSAKKKQFLELGLACVFLFFMLGKSRKFPNFPSRHEMPSTKRTRYLASFELNPEQN